MRIEPLLVLLAVGGPACWPGVLRADYLRRVGPNPIRLAAPERARVPPPMETAPAGALNSATNTPAAPMPPLVAPVAPAQPGPTPGLHQPGGDEQARGQGVVGAGEEKISNAGPTMGPEPEPGSGSDADAVSASPAVMPVDGVEMITPQMMMQFFEGRSGGKPERGTKRVIAFPVVFTPPEPREMPSSKATYEVE